MTRLTILTALLATSTNAATCSSGVHPACNSNFRAYNSTFYPNLLGQWTENEAQKSFSLFFPVRKSKCSDYLDLFLCSVLSPACVNDNLSGTLPYDIPVPPCQSLCQIVMTECASEIESFGIELPDEFSCERFPRKDSDHPCIPIQMHTEELPPGTLRWNIEETGGDLIQREMQCPVEQRSIYPDWNFGGLDSCTQPCDPMHHTSSEVTMIRVVVGVFATLTALVSAFAIFVFVHDAPRFQYPERPTLFFAMCYLGVSLVCLVGLISPSSIVCSDKIVNEDNVIEHGNGLIQGATSRPCTILFMLFFYFSTAGLCWWLALTMSWGLTAVFKWSSEAIATRSALLHVIGWATPAILMIIAVSKQEIQGDAYLGVCGLSDSNFSLWFLGLTPLAIVSTFGSIFFALGLCSLRSVKDQVEMDEETKQKLEIFVLRMTGFSVVVLIPQLTQLCLKFHEANQSDTWEKKFYGDNCDNLFVPCLSDEEAETLSAPSAFFIISKYIFLLLPALAPLTWIANEKTIRGWKMSSSASTLTSSSCVKSNLYHDKSSSFDGNDSRTDQSLSDGGIMPCPKELIVNYNQDTQLIQAV